MQYASKHLHILHENWWNRWHCLWSEKCRYKLCYKYFLWCPLKVHLFWFQGVHFELLLNVPISSLLKLAIYNSVSILYCICVLFAFWCIFESDIKSFPKKSRGNMLKEFITRNSYDSVAYTPLHLLIVRYRIMNSTLNFVQPETLKKIENT